VQRVIVRAWSVPAGVCDLAGELRARLHRSFADYGYFRTASLAPASVALRKSTSWRRSPARLRHVNPCPRWARLQHSRGSIDARSGWALHRRSALAGFRCVEGLIFSLMASNRNVEALQSWRRFRPMCARSLRPMSNSSRARRTCISRWEIRAGKRICESRAGLYLLHRGDAAEQRFSTHGCCTTRAMIVRCIPFAALDARADLTAPQLTRCKRSGRTMLCAVPRRSSKAAPWCAASSCCRPHQKIIRQYDDPQRGGGAYAKTVALKMRWRFSRPFPCKTRRQ